MKNARVCYALASSDESHWFLFGGVSEPSVIQDSACKLSWESIIVVDNADTTGVEIEGAWTESTSTPGYWPTNYLHDGNTGKGTKSVTFRPNLPSSGYYEVSIWYTAGANRATNVPMDIVSSCGTRTVLVNERVNGGKWMVLGTNNFEVGTSGYVRIRTDGTTSGYVIADAVRFRLLIGNE